MSVEETEEDQERSTDTLSYKKDESMPVKSQLMDMICKNPDLPTLGTSIASVVQISSSNDEPTQALANLILADVSLTQRILRLSNSVIFRASNSPAVTNITKSIQLLGLNTVKACTLAMMLVDGLQKQHAESVSHELSVSLSASLIGRKLAKRSAFPNAEEAAIAALFKNMGRLLVAAYDDGLYRKTMALVKESTHTKEQASLETISCSFDELTMRAMKEWKIPESIIKAMKLLPSKQLSAPKNRQEWMQQVTEFSETAALLSLESEQSADDPANEVLLNRFGTALNLDKNQLDSLLTTVAGETRELSNNTQLKQPVKTSAKKIKTTQDNDPQEDLLDELLINTDDTDSSQPIKTYPSGKPYNSLDQLIKGVQYLTEMTASKDCQFHKLMLQALETLYSSLGFNFATVCLKDIKKNQYQARNSLGKNKSTIQKNFIFSDNRSDDLFSLSIQKNIDLSISDSTDPKMSSRLPRWHKELMPDTKSFIILPLVINGKSIGLFYADRQYKAPEGISPDEMKLIKTLKELILTSLCS